MKERERTRELSSFRKSETKKRKKKKNQEKRKTKKNEQEKRKKTTTKKKERTRERERHRKRKNEQENENREKRELVTPSGVGRRRSLCRPTRDHSIRGMVCIYGECCRSSVHSWGLQTSPKRQEHFPLAAHGALASLK